jgi:parallel beta-helix repeat protein
LTVENGCSTGIVLRDCRRSRVENCLVRGLGKSGISLSGSRVSAVRCEVTQTASYAVSARGGDRKTLTPGDCAVLGCHLHHVGRLDWMGGRGVRLSGCGNRVAHNLIHHGPTGAVSYGGNEHVLELNEAHDMCIHYSDVGVFYTGRDWASRGNVVRWNYIHHNTNNEGHGSSGIYLDDCDSGDTVIGNIVFRGIGRGVLLGGGRDNTIRGNMFIDLPIGIHVDARGPRGITLDKPGSWNLLAKAERVGYQSPLWRERYPRLARVMDEDPLHPRGNVIHSNIMLGCEKQFGLSKGVEPEWLDREHNVSWKLADYPEITVERDGREQLDFARLPELWKKVPGFEPIPLDRIGPEGQQ